VCATGWIVGCTSGNASSESHAQGQVQSTQTTSNAAVIPGMTSINISAGNLPASRPEPVVVATQMEPVQVQPVTVKGEVAPIVVKLPDEGMQVKVASPVNIIWGEGAKPVPVEVTFAGGPAAIELSLKAGPLIKTDQGVIDVLLALNATLNAMRAEATSPKPPNSPQPPPNSDGTKPIDAWSDNDWVRASFLFLVIVGAGAFGGWVAHYLKSKEASRSELPKDIGVGILAALMVPGLLQTISDQHLAEVFRNYALWPGFASQCLIVAMVGMPFIEAVLRIANKRLADLGSGGESTTETTMSPKDPTTGQASNVPKPDPAQNDAKEVQEDIKEAEMHRPAKQRILRLQEEKERRRLKKPHG
jgi:hypothetical protein